MRLRGSGVSAIGILGGPIDLMDNGIAVDHNASDPAHLLRQDFSLRTLVLQGAEDETGCRYKPY